MCYHEVCRNGDITMNKKIIVLGALGLMFANTWGTNNENNHGNGPDGRTVFLYQIQSEQPMFDVFNALYEFYGVRFRIGEVENLFAFLQNSVNRDLIYIAGLQNFMRETMDIIMRGPDLSWIDITDRWATISLYLEHIEYENGSFRIVNPNNQ